MWACSRLNWTSPCRPTKASDFGAIPVILSPACNTTESRLLLDMFPWLNHDHASQAAVAALGELFTGTGRRASRWQTPAGERWRVVHLVVAGAPLRIAGYAGMGIADSFRVASRQAHTDPSGIRIRGGRRQSHSKAPADAASGGLCSNQLIFPPENGPVEWPEFNSRRRYDSALRSHLLCFSFPDLRAGYIPKTFFAHPVASPPAS